MNEWCQLQAYGAQDDGWYTSDLAIQTIMENLTPALWVTERAEYEMRAGPAPLDAPVIIPLTKRNRTLASWAGTMRRRGMCEGAIRAALLVANEEQCDPPLPEIEVVRIARSIARYPPSSPCRERPPLRTRWGMPHE